MGPHAVKCDKPSESSHRLVPLRFASRRQPGPDGSVSHRQAGHLSLCLGEHKRPTCAWRRAALVAASFAGAVWRSLRSIGGALCLRRGSAAAAIDSVIEECGADRVFWNRRHDPEGIAIDSAIKSSLKARGIGAASFDGQLLHEPTQVKTGAGNAFKVYTPFWRAFSALPAPRAPYAAPERLNGFSERSGVTRWRTGNFCPPARTGRKGLTRTGSPVRKGRRKSCACSSKAASAITPTAAIIRAKLRPRASPLTLPWVKSARFRSGMRRLAWKGGIAARCGSVPKGSGLARVRLSSAVSFSEAGDKEFQRWFRRFPMGLEA